MPHFRNPFFKKNRRVWYVEIHRKQHNLGPDKDEAFRRYHQRMAQPRQKTVVSHDAIAVVIDTFVAWTQELAVDSVPQFDAAAVVFRRQTAPLREHFDEFDLVEQVASPTRRPFWAVLVADKAVRFFDFHGRQFGRNNITPFHICGRCRYARRGAVGFSPAPFDRRSG